MTERFEQALQLAARLHSKQRRKGTRIPYVAHLLAVTALVLEDGGDEDQSIAALLHDAVEDQGGLKVLEDIRLRFGERVAVIVAGCSDSVQSPKPPWKERKERYIQRLQTASPDILLVSLADKLHNARSILADLEQHGDQVWWRFNGRREGTLWYYRSLLTIYQARSHSQMVAELGRIIDEIEKIAGH
jgi:(p)ppGpp synthase/HD superfamily hydrolase